MSVRVEEGLVRVYKGESRFHQGLEALSAVQGLGKGFGFIAV